jgi:hypothetical protein
MRAVFGDDETNSRIGEKLRGFIHESMGMDSDKITRLHCVPTTFRLCPSIPGTLFNFPASIFTNSQRTSAAHSMFSTSLAPTCPQDCHSVEPIRPTDIASVVNPVSIPCRGRYSLRRYHPPSPCIPSRNAILRGRLILSQSSCTSWCMQETTPFDHVMVCCPIVPCSLEASPGLLETIGR